MNITFINFSMQNGGSERVIAGLANDFAKRNDNVSIIVLNDKPSGYDLDDRIDIINLNVGRVSKNLFQSIGNLINEIKFFRKQILTLKSDVVISFQCKYAVVAKLACGNKVRVIGSERSNPYVSQKGFLANLLIKFSAILDGFIFQTEGAKGYYPKLIQKKSIVIPNAIFLKVPNEIPNYSVRPDVIVTTGRLIESKRHDLIIEAFAKITNKAPNYILNVFGEGSQKQAIEQMVTDLGLGNKVFLRGLSEDVALDLLSSKIFVFASDYEGMPNGLMEAMACGCACISTDCDFGPSELISNEKNGILVEKNNAEQLARYMLSLIENENLAKNVSHYAKGIADTHSLEKISGKYYQYICDMVR